ncbi:MAG TPA: ribose-5-phosphate isomerase RpiA [Pyrinomonadaceae bacterium]|jgi:ribose 5-phosphate isomerase A|nr:ribose-5-phosphate isomerase RpiA [Pyrinomonadaceae bacterium]
MNKSDQLKKIAGEKAAEGIRDGMTIGLGTGSTVYFTIMRVGELVRDGLRVRAIATSKQTEKLALENSIELCTFADVERLDLTIDGADELNPSLDLIKGGGGALLWEKLVAATSNRLIVVADESKCVETLGAFPLPVEIVPFAWQTTARRIEKLNVEPRMRMSGNEPFITDNGNYIIDCRCGAINNPEELHNSLKILTGVVETGLFIGMAKTAVIAGESGIRILGDAIQEP